MKDHFFFKHRFTKVLVNVVVFAQMLNLLFVGPVSAAVVNDPVVGTNTYLIATQMMRETAEKKVDQGFLAAGIASLIHASSYFMDKIAYDTAKAVAQGGKGLKSLVYEKDWGNYLEEVALDSAATFIDNFGKEALGMGLCQITDPHLLITLTLGFKTMYGAGGPQPDCTWQQLKNTWSPEAFEQRYGPGGKRFLAETFSANVKVSNSDFGIAINGIEKLDSFIKKDKEAAKEERQEGEGFKPVKDLITGNVKTPSQVVKDETSVASNKYKVQASNEALWGVAASGAQQVFIHAGSVFLNTLTSELLNQVLTKCWVNCGGGSDEEASEGVLGFYNSPARNDALSNNVFGKLLSARPTAQLNNYDLVSEFASCPDSPGINNCVIDTDFQKILSAGRNGTPMTIQEALDKQLLHADWPLISPRRTADNASEKHDCYMGKYCYSNIQKLRKVSILPIGFEVAALRSDPDRPWTLGNVVRNFETCLRVDNLGRPNPAGTQVKEDPAYPFCHLINPNWIIRVSSFQCDGKVITNSLLSANSPLRREECLDVKTCINEGENGSCGGAYGYCTQQKNIWRIPGETCPAEYNTCLTYTESKTRKNVSYLSRTVDPAECSIDNVGCRAYSMQKNRDGVWQGTSEVERNIPDFLAQTPEGRHNIIQLAKDLSGYHHLTFFDESIKAASSVCRPGNDGCSAFYPASRYEDGQYQKTDDEKFIQDKSQLVHLKKAPDYLGCYDSRPAVRENGSIDFSALGIEWPETLADIESGVSQSEACNAFASVCTESEIGCEAYTPQNGGPMIPGMIAAQNVCSSQCVGYQTFKQEAGELAKFDNEKFPLFFIPTQGQSCEAKYAGCEEFTNIDTRSQGGEKLEYYTDLKYCEKPASDGSNQKVFYTWEGSIREGLSLRTHQLMPISENEYNYIQALQNIPDTTKATFPETSPAYADDSETALLDFYSKCNEGSYNLRINNPYSPAAADPDCKAFYDDAGNVYYRLLSKLVTISPACHPIRKTKPEFVIDENLHGQAALCTSKGGFMNAEDDCQRCLNGGRFENNFCVYQTISQPGEATSCPASQNGCRAYTGSSANNLQEVFNDDFEANNEEAGAALIANWRPVNAAHIAAEATHVGSHSLEVNAGSGTVSRRVEPGEFADKGWYELTFWAKGAGKRMAVEFSQTEQARQVMGLFSLDPATRQPSLLSVDQEWRAYRLGPVQFTGSTSTAMSIDFQIQGDLNTPLYLDHVRLSQVRDHIYLKKDSWKTAQGYDVSEACDSAPLDSLPGEALGCAAYKDSKQQVRFATGFEKLCREKAVGCQPFWDTYNTVNGDDADKKQVFNLVCNVDTGRISATRKCELYSQGANAKKYGECQIKPGASFCYVPKVVIDDDTGPLIKFGPEAMVTSTVVILADTASTTPIFLANRKEFQCGESERGCMKVGLEEQILSTASVSSSFRYTDIMIKNDPELYTESLCRDDLVGCGEFKSGSEISYFKDPKVNGNALCTYKPQSEAGAAYGWYQEGVGTCANENTRLCRTNTDCNAGANCQNIGNVPCYANYRRQGNVYDIWSNNTPEYTDLVGTCPAKYNLCTELIDPADTSAVNPLGQPYYVIFNKQVTARVGECQGKVSLTEGCVLFNKTNEPNKLYNSIDTYSASSSSTPRYAPVIPSNNAGNNTNLILKVERDRMCSRWLQCSTQIRQVSESGKPVDLCYAFRECEQLQGNICVKWVDDFESNANIDAGKSRLTHDKYIRRGTSWYDSEYTGYSLYNKFRIQNMTYLVFDYKKLVDQNLLRDQDALLYRDRQFIAYEMNSEYFTGEYSGSGCMRVAGNNSTDFKACGYDLGGRCYKEKCIYPIGGPFTSAAYHQDTEGDRDEKQEKMRTLLNSLEGNSCKGYPEASSPFEEKVVIQENGSRCLPEEGEDCERKLFIQKKPDYANVEVCQDEGCSCKYQKVSYGGVVDYRSRSVVAKNNVPRGICSGGKWKDDPQDENSYDRTGFPCSHDRECSNVLPAEGEVNDGKCTLITKKEDHYGFEGYCLEYDYSRPLVVGDKNPFACLTWLPIGVSASGIDVYNISDEAGYNLALDAPAGGGEVYCAEATSRAAMQYDPGIVGLVNEVGNSGRFLDLRYSVYFEASGHLIFDNLDNLAEQKKAMQIYAWKKLGRNAVILRSEAVTDAGSGGPGDAEFEEGTQGRYFSSDHCAPVSIPLHFAPVTCEYEYPSAGPFLHPPRTWGRPVQAGSTHVRTIYLGRLVNNNGEDLVQNQSVYNSYYSYKLPYPDDDFDGFIDVQTAALSPEQNIKTQVRVVQGNVNADFYTSTNDLANRMLYRSSFEETLRESDIQRIYFIPTSFPDGAEEETAVPPGMSDELFIDFLALNKSEKHALVKNVKQGDGDVGDNDNEFYFGSVNSGVHNVFWTYKLEADSIAEQNKLISYTRYDEPRGATDIQEVNGMNYHASFNVNHEAERNRIAKRYVGVFYTDPERRTPPAFAGRNDCAVYPCKGSGGPPTRAGLDGDDPFTALCEASNEADNWFAIGLDFNENGEFLGYISRYCNAGWEAGNQARAGVMGYTFTTIATLNDQCTDFMQVHDENVADPVRDNKNKAWTDRVWSGTLAAHPHAPYSDLVHDTMVKPFGTLNIDPAQTPINEDSIQKLRQYTFQYPLTLRNVGVKASGVPYRCGNEGGNFILSGNNCETLRSRSRGDGENDLKYPATVVAQIENKNSAAAVLGIKQLFARTFRGFRFDTTRSGDNVYAATVYNGNTNHNDGQYTDGSSSIVPSNGQEILRPPVIYSLNPLTCSLVAGETCTIAQKDNMSVNGRNGVTKDYDGDGLNDDLVDSIIQNGSYTAELRFFAFADDNRMPIKKVMVNWGDNSVVVNDDRFGNYKNRKPFCDVGALPVGLCGSNVTDAVNKGITCKETKDCPEAGTQCLTNYVGQFGRRFGNQPRACSAGYFQFVHDYSCSRSDVLDGGTAQGGQKDYVMPISDPRIKEADRDRLLSTGLTEQDVVCVFRPKVQVLDNWGWCNGSDDVEGLVAKASGWYGERFCDGSRDEAWTAYKGLIILIPPSPVRQVANGGEEE